MTERTIDIERVVREVLAEFGLAADENGSPPESKTVLEKPPASAQAKGGDLAVGGRVITLTDVEGRLDGVRRLVVPPGAVVTPSVRDELHRKSIALVFGRPARTERDAGVRLVLSVLGSRFDPAPLVGALDSEGIDVDVRRQDCLIAATDELAKEVSRPDTLGVAVTAHPAAAVCLANRHRGVRAVLGFDAAQLAADVASVGANLLVVNPRSTSVFQLKQMVTQFSRAAPGECPEVFRRRLG